MKAARVHRHVRTDRVAILLRLLQLDLQPVVPVSLFIQVEGVVPPVAVVEPAELRVDIEVSVTIPVEESDPVPLAEVSQPREPGEVLESLSAAVLIEDVRLHAAQLGIARSQVDLSLI